MLLNILIWAVLSTGYYFYLSHYAARIPGDWAILINFILIPLISGALAQFLYRGTQAIRMAFTVMIPVIPAIVFGGDPKFPGLQVSLVGMLAFGFGVGAIASAESIKAIRKWLHIGDHS